MKKPTYLQADYIDVKINQLMLWANGSPTHDYIYNECCMDFSCCHPELFEKDNEKRMSYYKRKMDELLERRRQEDNL